MTDLLLKISLKDEDYYDCSLEHKEVIVEELLEEQGSYSLYLMGYIKIDKDKDKDLSKETVRFLREKGWSHVDSAKNREEKKVLAQKYYLIYKEGDSYNYGYAAMPKFSEIDLDDISDEQIQQLAKGGEIVQSVTLKSILSAKDYKKLQTKKKVNKEKADRAKAVREKKAKTTKEKALEKARKLLQEAGEA